MTVRQCVEQRHPLMVGPRGCVSCDCGKHHYSLLFLLSVLPWGDA